MTHLSLFVGPVLAGVAISLLDRGTTHTTLGIALAFGLDSLSFLVSISMLSMMRIESTNVTTDTAESGVLASIREGLLYVWNDATLKLVFAITMGLNLLINGPFAVGIPVVVRTRFPEGAAAFGLVMSLFGGGAFLGTILSGVLPRPSKKLLGTVSLSLLSIMGMGLVVIASLPRCTSLRPPRS